MNDVEWHRRRPDPDAIRRGAVPASGTLIGSDAVRLRVFLRHNAWQALHDLFDVAEEEIGLLVGDVYADDNGPFLVVEDALKAAHTRDTSGGVTFTDQSWSALRRRWKRHHPNRLVVGSFRIRPGAGTALSPYDEFGAARFFPEWHHVLYVVDPQRERQGLFHWDNGRLRPLPGFWVCDDEAPIAAAGVVAVAPPAGAPGAAEPASAAIRHPSEPDGATPRGEQPSRSRRRTSLIALAALLLLLLPWACVQQLPGSVPHLRRDVEEAISAGEQLAVEADGLRADNERLEKTLDVLEKAEATAETVEVVDDADEGDEGKGDRATGDEIAAVDAADDTAADARPNSDGPTSPPPSPIAAAGGLPSADSRYVIRDGDTLWSISTRLLGDPYAYTDLAEDNEITDPNLILPGWELQLPPP